MDFMVLCVISGREFLLWVTRCHLRWHVWHGAWTVGCVFWDESSGGVRSVVWLRRLCVDCLGGSWMVALVWSV